jgi:hypothetical protein
MAQERPQPNQIRAPNVEEARHRFAEELRYTARVRSPKVVAAFAKVPREHFVGSGPWRVLSPMSLAEYWTTEDARPHHLYYDILIAIDPIRRLNNGQPSLWAHLYDQLDLQSGAHVVHVGAGTGYYSAILAEISVAPEGSPRSRSTPTSPSGRDRIWRWLGHKRWWLRLTVLPFARTRCRMRSSSMPG